MSEPVSSSGTLVGAALETLGYHFQAHVLDSLTVPLTGGVSLLESVGSFVYIVVAILAIGSIAFTGKYKFGIWLLLGPGMFYATLFPRVQIEGASWVFGGEVRNPAIVQGLVKNTLVPDEIYKAVSKKAPLEPVPNARVSWFFKAWVETINKPLRSMINVLNSSRYQQDLRFVTRMQLLGVLQTSQIKDPGFRDLVNYGMLNQCRDVLDAGERSTDLAVPLAEREKSAMELFRLHNIKLDGDAANYLAGLKVDYPELWTKMVAPQGFGKIYESRVKLKFEIQKEKQEYEDAKKGKAPVGSFSRRYMMWEAYWAYLLGWSKEDNYDTIANLPTADDIKKEYEQKLTPEGSVREGVRYSIANSLPNLPEKLVNQDISKLISYIDSQEAQKRSMTVEQLVSNPCDKGDGTRATARNCQIEDAVNEITKRTFECDEIWNILFVGMIRESRMLVDSTLKKAETWGIDIDQLVADWLAASAQKVVHQAGWNPNVEQEFNQSGKQADIEQAAFRRLILYRAIAKQLFRNELVSGSPHAVIAQLAHRAQDMKSVIYRGENELSAVERSRVINVEWRERTRMMYTAASLPYYQGLILYVLSVTYPFFAFLLLVPGRHGSFLMWFGLWFWVKSWDVGYAVVMMLDQVFFSLFSSSLPHWHNMANTDPGLSPSMLTALSAMRAADPTFNLSTYYSVIGMAMSAVPIVTSYLILGSLRGGASVISQGIDRYADNFAGGAFKYSSQFGVYGYRHSTFDRRMDDEYAYAAGDSGFIGFNGANTNRVANMNWNSDMLQRSQAVMGPFGVTASKSTTLQTAQLGAAAGGASGPLQDGLPGRFVGSLKQIANGTASGSGADYRAARQGQANREAASQLVGGAAKGVNTLAGSIQEISLSSLRDRRALEIAWAGIDSMTSQPSARDVEMIRVYDGFELPLVENEIDGNRVEFDAYLKRKMREKVLIADTIKAFTQIGDGILDARRTRAEESAWAERDAAKRGGQADRINSRYQSDSERFDKQEGRLTDRYNNRIQDIEDRYNAGTISKDQRDRMIGQADWQFDVGKGKLDAGRNLSEQRRDGALDVNDRYSHQLEGDVRAGMDRLNDRFFAGRPGDPSRHSHEPLIERVWGGNGPSDAQARKIATQVNDWELGYGKEGYDPFRAGKSVAPGERGHGMTQVQQLFLKRDDVERKVLKLTDESDQKAIRRRPLRMNAESVEQAITIGAVLPLSGDFTSLGQSIRSGIELALSELEPNIQRKLNFNFVDSKSLPGTAQLETEKLLIDGRSKLLIGATSGCCQSMCAAAESRQIPLLALASDSSLARSREYVMNFWVSPETVAETAVTGLVEKGFKRVAIVYSVHEWALSFLKVFEDENAGRVEVAFQKGLGLRDNDYRQLFQTLARDSNVDALLVALVPGQVGEFAKQCKQRNLTIPLFGIETFEDAVEIKRAEGGLNKQTFVGSQSLSDEFVEKFRERYGQASIYGAGYGYELVKVVAGIVDGAQTAVELNTRLHKVFEHQGVMGPLSATAENGFTFAAVLAEVP